MSQFNAPTYDIERPTNRCAFSGKALLPGEAYMAALVELPLDGQGDGQTPKNPAAPAATPAATPVTPAAPVASTTSDKPRSAAADLGLRRVDVSMDAWGQGKRPEHVFGYWKSIVPQPNQKRRLFVDDGVLVQLLARLADARDAKRLAFRHVLCLILMRKKQLRYERTESRMSDLPPEALPEAAPGAMPSLSVGSQTPGVRREPRDWWILTPKLDPAKGPMGKWNESERVEVMDPRLDEAQIRQVSEQLSEILQAEL